MKPFEQQQIQQDFAKLIENALNRACGDAECGRNKTVRERAAVAACALDYLWQEFRTNDRW